MSVFLLRYRGIPSGSLGFQRNHFVTPCESQKKGRVSEKDTLFSYATYNLYQLTIPKIEYYQPLNRILSTIKMN